MNDTTESEIQTVDQTLAAMKKHWLCYLLLGTLLMVLGVIGMVYSSVVSMVVMIWLGAMLIAAAIIQFIYSFYAKYWKGFFIHVLLSLLTLGVGIYLISNPLQVSVIFTMVIAIFLIITGLLRMAFAIQVRKQVAPWWLILLSGLIAIVLGILIITHWPVSGLWVIGLFISLEVALNGWSMFVMSIAAKAHKQS